MDKLTISGEKQVTALSQSAADLFNAGLQGSENTMKAYAADLKEFERYCLSNCYDFLPSTPATVANFLGHLNDIGRKPATIERKLASISKAHKAQGFESPASNQQIKIVLDGIKRKLGTEQEQAKAFDTKILESKIERIPNTLKGARDKAIILIGFAGAFRRSEISGLALSDLDFQDDALIIRIGKSKSNQYGKYQYKAIFYASNPTLCPVRNLKAYLKLAGEREQGSKVFVSISKGGHLSDCISDKAINNIVKARLGADFSGHSLRASFVTVAAMNGASDSEIMNQTKHKTQSMIRRYTRIDSAKKHNAAMKLGI